MELIILSFTGELTRGTDVGPNQHQHASFSIRLITGSWDNLSILGHDLNNVPYVNKRVTVALQCLNVKFVRLLICST